MSRPSWLFASGTDALARRIAVAVGLDVGAAAPIIGLVVLAAASASDAGYFPRRWYPAAMALVAILALCLLLRERGPRPPRAVWVAVGALAGLAAWSFASMLWAEDVGAAYLGGGRTLLFAVVFGLFAMWALPARTAGLLVGLYVAFTAGRGLVALLEAQAATNVDELFVNDRLVSIAGYSNASAAFLLMAVVPALALAVRREVPWLLRGAFAGAAVILIDVAAMSQSRATLAAVPITLAIWIAVTPGRARGIVAIAVVAAGAALSLPSVLGDLDAFRVLLRADADPRPALDSVAAPVLIAAAATALFWGFLAYSERWFDPDAQTRRRLSLAVGGTAAAVVAAGTIGFFTVADGAGRFSDAWDSLRNDAQPTLSDDNRFASGFGGFNEGRREHWRVAWLEFADHPLIGIGADNFLQAFQRRGRTGETPRFPHSIQMRTLSQLGVVGAALLIALLVAAGIAVAQAIRRGSEGAAAVAAGAAMCFTYWFVHGSVDWFFEYAGLGGLAFAMLGVACAVGPRERAPDAERALVGGAVRVSAVVLATAGLLVLLGTAWLSERWTDAANRVWRSNPAAAFEDVDRAAAANPFSDRPYLVGGVIAVEIDDLPKARDLYRDALDRDPENQFATLQLAAIASELGQWAEAEQLARRAVALAPRDAVARDVLIRVSKRQPVRASEINERLRQRAQDLRQ